MSATDSVASPTSRQAVAPAQAALRLAALRARGLEIARFLSVGGVAFVVDIGVFNLLRFGPGGLLEEK